MSEQRPQCKYVIYGRQCLMPAGHGPAAAYCWQHAQKLDDGSGEPVTYYVARFDVTGPVLLIAEATKRTEYYLFVNNVSALIGRTDQLLSDRRLRVTDSFVTTDMGEALNFLEHYQILRIAGLNDRLVQENNWLLLIRSVADLMEGV